MTYKILEMYLEIQVVWFVITLNLQFPGLALLIPWILYWNLIYIFGVNKVSELCLYMFQAESMQNKCIE